MAFEPPSFSFAVPPRVMIHFGPPPAYQTSMPLNARHDRIDGRLAEELELRLHIDSLPIPQSVRLNEYSIPSDGIRWDIFDKNITKLLGEEAYLWNTVSYSTSVFLDNSYSPGTVFSSRRWVVYNVCY